MRSLFVAAVAIAFLFPRAAEAGDIKTVFVIAPSKSTRAQARKTMDYFHWKQAAYTDARYILVATRSEFQKPLAGSYDSVDELENEVLAQDNDSGAKSHVYLYEIGYRGVVGQIDHVTFKADDDTPRVMPHERFHAVLPAP